VDAALTSCRVIVKVIMLFYKLLIILAAVSAIFVWLVLVITVLCCDIYSI